MKWYGWCALIIDNELVDVRWFAYKTPTLLDFDIELNRDAEYTIVQMEVGHTVASFEKGTLAPYYY
jgi:hypothetical protein